MLEIVLCYSLFGIIIGIIFSLLFINLDKAWKKILTYLFGTGGTGGIIYTINDYYSIGDKTQKLLATSALLTAFILTFLVGLVILCYLIKDKDDKDVLRIRDILLGQKSYINKYYEKRCKEIDRKLNIEILEKRESEVAKRENSIKAKEEYIEQELSKIDKLGNKKLRLQLPEKSNIIITNEFLKTMPSYIRDLSKCINAIEKFTDQYIEENNDINITKFTSYLMSICLSVSGYIFGGSAQDVRIHFRKYDDNTKMYEKLIAIIGNKAINRKMTSIPYSESMIERSDICKRALIKSINSNYDFSSKNNTVWKDYMTFSFYGIRHDEVPILSFGISVKNEERFKQIFYFLNFFRIEECLEENLEKINDSFNIEKVFYS